MIYIKNILMLLLLLSIQIVDGQEVSTLLTDNTKDFEALHWHPDGRIYITDYNNGKLYKITMEGNVETIVEGFSAIAGGGFDSAGNFYFSGINVGKVYRLNDDYSYEEVGNGFNQPVTFLQSATEDSIAYICEYGNNRVSKLNVITGQVSLLASNQGINGPDGMVYDKDNNILVANFNNHQIHKIDEDGNVSLYATVPAGGFMGYISRDDKYVYVCSVTSKKIYRIDDNGIVEHIAGSGIMGSSDGSAFDATFQNPNGIGINSTRDTLLIADDNTIRMLTNFTTTGVKEYSLELEEFVASPNPVKELLDLSYSYSSAFNLFYEIISFDGKQVISQKEYRSISGKNLISIDCGELMTGLYFVKIWNKEGKVFVKNFYKG